MLLLTPLLLLKKHFFGSLIIVLLSLPVSGMLVILAQFLLLLNRGYNNFGFRLIMDALIALQDFNRATGFRGTWLLGDWWRTESSSFACEATLENLY